MDGAITISLVTAGLALSTSAVTAVVGYLSSKRLAEINAKIDDDKSEQAAFRDYLYDARKRMYSELLPFLFLLVEQGDDAFWRLHGIAHAASDRRLDPGNKRFPSHISSQHVEHHDYFISTIYRLTSPFALVKMCQERLTSIDLSADDYAAHVYNLGKLLRRTWNSADELGRHDAPIDQVIPRLPGQQINLREFDLFVETLITRVPGQEPRIRSYTDVIDLYTSPDSPLSQRIKPFERIFENFHPSSKPLLWRALLAQATIFGEIRMASESRNTHDRSTSRTEVAPLEAQFFDWDTANTTEGHRAEVQAGLDAAHEFVTKRMAPRTTEAVDRHEFRARRRGRDPMP